MNGYINGLFWNVMGKTSKHEDQKIASNNYNSKAESQGHKTGYFVSRVTYIPEGAAGAGK